ncbi:hypothetical protein Rhopal_006339-T1 [Rhodotorula paludigena]|uniref:Uncharacterized protein n=1 Tax=Rhodotorula paludigena TaxID=86838 RepID=A0AAV5GW76_9BASI|nr:hypothetical protein Rhopal_006339-T1 [Rhodotorula paludigena]
MAQTGRDAFALQPLLARDAEGDRFRDHDSYPGDDDAEGTGVWDTGYAVSSGGKWATGPRAWSSRIALRHLLVLLAAGVATILLSRALPRHASSYGPDDFPLDLNLSRYHMDNRTINDLRPAQQFRLLRSSLQPEYVAGDVLLARVVGPSPEVEDQSWLRMVAVGDRGQRATGYPMPAPYHGWVLPLLEPGRWTLDVRLIDYNISDIVDRNSSRVRVKQGEVPPAWSVCYNDTISDGVHSFEVLPAPSDLFSRVRLSIASVPSAVRTLDMETAGTLVGQPCANQPDVLSGLWSTVAEGGAFQAFTGCEALSTAKAAVGAHLSRLPTTPIKWVRFIGDSNTRNIFKDGIPWRDLRLPTRLYPVELPSGRGTPPCIYGFNPVHGKDEQFLCVLRYGRDRTPLLFTYEWYTLEPHDSELIEAVYPRNVRQAFSTAYSNVSVLNGYFAGRFGRYDTAYNVTHTVETLLAPFPDLLELEYADHTLVSFGSHRAEAPPPEWQAHLDYLASAWPRSRNQSAPIKPGQPLREDLTFIYTTPANTPAIPEVRRWPNRLLRRAKLISTPPRTQKFWNQHIIRNGRRIEARNAQVRNFVASLPAFEPTDGAPPASASILDLYGLLLPLIEVQADPVHSVSHIYRLNAQLVLDHVIRSRAVVDQR